jgi:serine/threonine-protein kinase
MTVDGKYRLTSLIGIGGMGIVYEAEHLFMGRRVAVKVLHPRYEDAHEAAVRFLDEARTAGTVLHRTIVEVLDAGFVDGTTPYLVMERLSGENLRDGIQRRQALRSEEVAVVLCELLKGLASAHGKGVIHCDLKPENLFLVDKRTEIGCVKILDFGVARMALGAAGEGRPHVSTRVPDPRGEPRPVAGTLAYMPPEQILGESLSPRTDLYALGVVAFECLTGEPPFALEPLGSLRDRILRGAPARLVGRLESVLPSLSQLVHALMSKRPEERPARAQDALQMLVETGLLSGHATASLGRLLSDRRRT